MRFLKRFLGILAVIKFAELCQSPPLVLIFYLSFLRHKAISRFLPFTEFSLKTISNTCVTQRKKNNLVKTGRRLLQGNQSSCRRHDCLYDKQVPNQKQP